MNPIQNSCIQGAENTTLTLGAGLGLRFLLVVFFFFSGFSSLVWNSSQVIAVSEGYTDIIIIRILQLQTFIYLFILFHLYKIILVRTYELKRNPIRNPQTNLATINNFHIPTQLLIILSQNQIFWSRPNMKKSFRGTQIVHIS